MLINLDNCVRESGEWIGDECVEIEITPKGEFIVGDQYKTTGEEFFMRLSDGLAEIVGYNTATLSSKSDLLADIADWPDDVGYYDVDGEFIKAKDVVKKEVSK